MDKKTILVTGVGGNVGQGIIRNIRSSYPDIRIIGTNTTSFSAGNHLCDIFLQVPYAYDTSYIPTIIELVNKHRVDIIIPSTDYEVYYLAKNRPNIDARIAASGEQASGIYLDKYLSWKFHSENGIPFTNSILPSVYQQSFNKAIAKPRKGRGSRGLIKNVSDVSQLKDDEYIIQELHEGIEITTAVYCAYKNRSLHGLITLERELEGGATVACHTTTAHDGALKKIAQAIIDKTDVAGAFNIQSIVTANGEIHVFEINCRISGTNSIRSHFGFKDVNYTVQELLLDTSPEPCITTQGVAYRYLADVIYPAANLKELKGTNQDKFIIF